MAFRMQASIPGVTDFKDEPAHIMDMYGPDSRNPGSFASNCILARRLAENGVRFIQLYQPNWDMHGHIVSGMPKAARFVDQPAAALLQDLKQRDMLKDTLVVMGTEFGRTCYSQGRLHGDPPEYGREHHRDCFTMWMAGGGVRGGMTYGASDDLGFSVAQDPVTVHDFHATMLHLLGIDHERFTYRFQGRDFRLTDVSGEVVKKILA
jgi:arylsulfatase A-like enzyme